MKLSKRQAELLTRVCLKRYDVTFHHYMGSFQPNESVDVRDGDDGSLDRSFRPATVGALQQKGLVRFKQERLGAPTSTILPTHEGLDWFHAEREKASA